MTNLSLYILPVMILGILIIGIAKKVPIYEEFVEGAKDGFKVSVSIIPYLVAIIVGISMSFLCNFKNKMIQLLLGQMPQLKRLGLL